MYEILMPIVTVALLWPHLGGEPRPRGTGQ